jgi:hypothetical protein
MDKQRRFLEKENFAIAVPAQIQKAPFGHRESCKTLSKHKVAFCKPADLVAQAFNLIVKVESAELVGIELFLLQDEATLPK